MTKLCYLNQDKSLFLSIWTSCRTGCMRTVLGSLKLSRFELTGLVHLDYHVWGDMLQKRHKLQPKTKTTDKLSCHKNTLTRRCRTSSSA